MRKLDSLTTTWIQAFLDSKLFRCCLLNRKTLALLILTLWGGYSYFCYTLLRGTHPDVSETLTFIFLVSLPMAVCLYFTCGFHVVESVGGYTVNGEMNDVQIENPFDRLWVEHLEFDEHEHEQEHEHEEDAPLLGSAQQRVTYNIESDDDDGTEEEEVMATREGEMATQPQETVVDMLPPVTSPPPTGVAALRGLYAAGGSGIDDCATDHSLNNPRV